MQIFTGQQNRYKAIQGGSISSLNASVLPLQQQMLQLQQQLQQ
jgi:hypothetical protein